MPRPTVIVGLSKVWVFVIVVRIFCEQCVDFTNKLNQGVRNIL